MNQNLCIILVWKEIENYEKKWHFFRHIFLRRNMNTNVCCFMFQLKIRSKRENVTNWAIGSKYKIGRWPSNGLDKFVRLGSKQKVRLNINSKQYSSSWSFLQQNDFPWVHASSIVQKVGFWATLSCDCVLFAEPTVRRLKPLLASLTFVRLLVLSSLFLPVSYCLVHMCLPLSCLSMSGLV